MLHVTPRALDTTVATTRHAVHAWVQQGKDDDEEEEGAAAASCLLNL
jgi:hypothetical protein